VHHVGFIIRIYDDAQSSEYQVLLTYIPTYYLLTCLLQLSCHSVAAVLTLVHTKQIRINIHKQNNTKHTVKTTQNTLNTSMHITKTRTHYKTRTTTHYKTK
jgi:hypothetical protein